MLTDRQQEIYDFVVEYVENRGYPPTVREIGERVGLASPSTVHAHLATLEREGLIRRGVSKMDGRSRAITLSKSGFEKLKSALPLWQRAQAKFERDNKAADLRKTLASLKID